MTNIRRVFSYYKKYIYLNKLFSCIINKIIKWYFHKTRNYYNNGITTCNNNRRYDKTKKTIMIPIWAFQYSLRIHHQECFRK